MQIAKSGQQRITADELWKMPELSGRRFELVNGELVESPVAGLQHNLIAALVFKVLDVFVREQDLGLVFTDGAGYVLRSPDLMRIPDVSFVSWAQVPEDGLAEGYGQFAPALVVEVISPTDRAGEMREKLHDYLEAGTNVVWVLWPDLQAVSVHAAGGITRELGPDDELDGGEVLPSFRVPVRDLFKVRSRR